MSLVPPCVQDSTGQKPVLSVLEKGVSSNLSLSSMVAQTVLLPAPSFPSNAYLTAPAALATGFAMTKLVAV